MVFSSPTFPSDAVFFSCGSSKNMFEEGYGSCICLPSPTCLLDRECSCFRFSILCSLIRPHLNLQETSLPSLVERHLVNSFRITKAKKMKLHKHSQWRIHRLQPSRQRVKYKWCRCTLLLARLSSSSVYIHRTAMR